MSKFFSSRFAALAAYTPGEQPQDQAYIKLNTNESPYPPSPATRAAIDDAALSSLNLYPDPSGARLRAKLAARYGVEAENVFLANGSDEILSFAFMGFCDAERPAAFADISYGFYPVYANLYGIQAEIVPLKDDLSMDVDGLCRTRGLCVVANPNSPTGIALPLCEIERLLKSDPNRIVLVDEAYIDFGGSSAVSLLGKYENLIVSQTYSKSRSMAGGRLGFALADAALVRDLETLRFSTNPYNLDRLTLALGEAALDDDAYYMENCKRIIATRERTAARLASLGFALTRSAANFLFAKHPAIGGEALYLALKKRGVLVRHFSAARIADYVRVTVGAPEQMEAFLAAVESILKGEANAAM